MDDGLGPFSSEENPGLHTPSHALDRGGVDVAEGRNLRRKNGRGGGREYIRSAGVNGGAERLPIRYARGGFVYDTAKNQARNQKARGEAEGKIVCIDGGDGGVLCCCCCPSRVRVVSIQFRGKTTTTCSEISTFIREGRGGILGEGK